MRVKPDQRPQGKERLRRQPIRRPSLAAQTEQILSERLLSGEFRPGDQLPAEHELAEEFRVSRATIRAAFAALVRRGLVVQRQGVGTFAAVGSGLTNDLAQATDLGELLRRRHGEESKIAFDELTVEPAHSDVAEALEINESDPVVVSAKRFMVDGETLVYVLNSIPVAVVGSELADRMMDEPQISEPLFDFLEAEVGVRAGPQLARIFPELGSAIRHPCNTVPRDAPVLRIEEVGYSDGNQPIWHSHTWFPPGAMNVELIRQPPTQIF